jgi:hypothetical protein
MKEKIILELGENHLDPIEFDNVPYNDVYGLYTYKNDVFCLKDGMDMSFDELTINEQKNIVSMFESKKWKINKSLQ